MHRQTDRGEPMWSWPVTKYTCTDRQRGASCQKVRAAAELGRRHMLVFRHMH